MRRLAATLVMALTAATGLAGVTAAPALAGTAADTGHPASSAHRDAAAPTPLRLMPLGDSITWGVGSSTGNGYRAPLWDELSADGHSLDFVGTGRNGSMSDPDNEGHSGYRIDQDAALVDASLARYRPNVVTLEIGTNDLNQAYQVSTAPARLQGLIDQITADAPDATVLVASLIVSTSSVEEPYRGSFNQQIPGIVQAEQSAGKHVAYVDMGALTTADLSDSLHPDDGGYQKMADAFGGAVQAADGAGWITAPVTVPGGFVDSGIAGKCLDFNGGSSADGTPAQLWTCNSSDAQWWSLHTDGTMRAAGKCLDATGGGTADGTPAELWDCDGGANQVWQPHDGGYLNPVSGRCLDDPSSSTTDGTQLQLWDCNGTGAQQWTALPAV